MSIPCAIVCAFQGRLIDMRQVGGTQIVSYNGCRDWFEARASKSANILDVRYFVDSAVRCARACNQNKAAASVISASTRSQTFADVTDLFRPNVFDRRLRCPLQENIGKEIIFPPREHIFRTQDSC